VTGLQVGERYTARLQVRKPDGKTQKIELEFEADDDFWNGEISVPAPGPGLYLIRGYLEDEGVIEGEGAGDHDRSDLLEVTIEADDDE
jgi:predicted metalloprotease with PDZ domain